MPLSLLISHDRGQLTDSFIEDCSFVCIKSSPLFAFVKGVRTTRLRQDNSKAYVVHVEQRREIARRAIQGSIQTAEKAAAEQLVAPAVDERRNSAKDQIPAEQVVIV